MRETRRPWLLPLLIGLAIFFAAAAAMSYMFFVLWTDVTDALPAEAEEIFAAAIAEAGGAPPYIEIADDGSVEVHRDQENDEVRDFDALTVLAWTPGEQKILRWTYPRWFVRLKTSSSLNLGTMVATLSKDWDQLDLSVSFADLQQRGPALLLDHRLDNGARIILWTAAKND